MDQIQKTRELRRKLSESLPRGFNYLATIKQNIENSNLSAHQKEGYLNILQRMTIEHQRISHRLQHPDLNSYKEYLAITELEKNYIKWVQDLKKVQDAVNKEIAKVPQVSRSVSPSSSMRSQSSSSYLDLPDAPITPSRAASPQLNVPPDRIERFVAISNKMRATHNSIQTVRGFSAKTVEEKIKRYSVVSSLTQKEQELQARMERLGQAFNTTRVPLTPQQVARLDKSLNEISKEVEILNKRIAQAYAEAMPNMPNKSVKPPSDSSSSSFKPK